MADQNGIPQAGTDELIGALVEDADPVGRLQPPFLRATLWLLASFYVIGLFVYVHGMRPDLPDLLKSPAYVLPLGMSLVTGVLAAYAAFHVAVPGRSAAWNYVPLVPLAIWAETIAFGCFLDWVRWGAKGLEVGTSFTCFSFIVAMSVPIVGLLAWMLRPAASHRPVLTIAYGTLAAAGLASTGLSLFHGVDATIMVLVWHGGTGALLVALAARFAPETFFRPLADRARLRPRGQPDTPAETPASSA
jgi:hypothetical protein